MLFACIMMTVFVCYAYFDNVQNVPCTVLVWFIGGMYRSRVFFNYFARML